MFSKLALKKKRSLKILHDFAGSVTIKSKEGKDPNSCDHVFKSDLLAVLEKCGFCGREIDSEGKICKGCNFHCHDKCEKMVKEQWSREGSVNSAHSKFKTSHDEVDLGKRSRLPASPKNLVTNICHHMRHRVSRNRVRHVDENFDLDMTYITDRIIAMSFPASGLETTYRNNLREVAKMLQTNHQDKYMVFNLSERRYDISKLNHQVLDFGWPDHLAPPLERLCSIIKSIDSWLKSDPLHVVVVHCKGGKGRTGVVIAAYMHFSKICSSPQAALDWFAMKRFYDDSLGGVTQPSQRRYVHYFSDYLDGKVKLNTDPIFLHHIIVHGIPSFDTKDGCKPFLRVYVGLKLIYTSGVYHVTPDMERICITIEGGLILHGDVLIKCYHKNTLSSGRDIIFRCQFHTSAIRDYGLELDKIELDDACKDRKFPDGCKVEFVFSATGNFVSDIKINERLRSIIRHSLQPVENPDTVLYPLALDNWYESSTDGAGSSVAGASNTKEDYHSKSDKREQDSAVKGGSDALKRPPEYVAGPVNGHLYAQVDKAFKKKLRSMSLDSGARSRAADHLNFFENRANTLNRRNAHGFRNRENEDFGLTQPSLQHNTSKMQHSSGDCRNSEVKSIDRLLQELGECSEILDSTLQQARSSSRGVQSSSVVNGGSRSAIPPGPPVRQKASFEVGQRYSKSGLIGEPLLQNGISAVRYNQSNRPSFGTTQTRVPIKPPPYSQNSSWNGDVNTAQMSNGYSDGEAHSVVLHEAPLPKISPPMCPLSPTYFATTEMMPRTIKAKTVTHTTVGYNFVPNSGDHLDGSGRNEDVSVTSQWTTSNSGKLRQGPKTFDFNNNDDKVSDVEDFFDLEGRKTIQDSETLPEKGNVRSKIALLSDMFQPDRVRPPPHQNIKGHIIPMPGLACLSATEVSKEISNYNAKSLAPGEISHSSGTLYISGAPPKRIVEQTKHVEEPPKETDLTGFQESRLPPARDYLIHKTDFMDHHHVLDKSPRSSIDGISLDEGVESKGSIDEQTNLGTSPSASSDGHTDSAFGESIVSTSSVSTPVAGHSSNRFNTVATTSMNQEGEEAVANLVSEQSSSSNLLESAAVHLQQAREDEEAGYARLEDIQAAKKTQESPGDGVAMETQAAPEEASTSATPVVEPIVEQIQITKTASDVEAIKDILSEMADMGINGPQLPQLSRSSTPQSLKSRGIIERGRSPLLSDGSGSFENAVQRKKSHPVSDKGYGSTNSVSSGSSNDNVFLPESPKIPGLKFDRDTSEFWYKPTISRNDANDILKDSEPGSFIIRDSQSFPGAFGLAVKVAVPPAHVLQGLQGDLTKVDLDNELVRHFLIETTKKGVRLKGYNDEPIFGSLAAFVYQHSITPLALPIRLKMPDRDLSAGDKDQSLDKEDGQNWPKGAVGSLMYLGQCEVEMLTGASAIQRTVEFLSTEEAAKKFTTVSFKVTQEGMTVTDTERKVFFRQHFHMNSILYCGIDPSDKRWDLKTPTYSGKSKSFGLVMRKTGGVHNECHLFGEISKDWPASILVNILNRFMNSST
ncbi:tensin-like isoform X3 [Stylophora pistillata]|uniref:tensin-like isoform X3 n=1 Tax=Stylophora pistillata TaxID=50429 RepID=UPI000C040C2F|nr:tensin-like isoform X3 [Stylophora pistillata]